MTKPPEQLLSQRFPLLAFAAAVICFFLFPLFLTNAALDRVLTLKAAKELSTKSLKLEKALDLIEQYSDDSHFAHLILSQAFRIADNAQNPREELTKQIKRLKKQLPGAFFFIPWSKDGTIIKELSDEQSYAYILRETFKLLHEVKQHCRAYVPAALQSIPDVDRRLKVLRHFLGRLLPLNRLDSPLQPGRLARTILVEPEGEKHQLWYAIGRKISLLCFIHSDFYGQHTGIQFAFNHLRKANPAMETGVVNYPITAEAIKRGVSQTSTSEIVLTLGKFENLHPGNILIHNNQIFAYRLINQKLRAFCSLGANDLTQPDLNKASLIASCLKWLLIICFVLSVYSLKRGITFVSAGLKLTALFLYAAGIPVLIATVIAADFLHQKKAELIYESQSMQLAKLRDIDDGFKKFLTTREQALQKILARFAEQDELFFLNPSLRHKFVTELYEKVKPDSVGLYDQQGKNLTPGKSKITTDDTIISQLCTEIIAFINQQKPGAAPLSILARPLAVEFLYKQGRISSLNLGENTAYTCYQSLGHTQQYATKAVLFIAWPIETLQRDYLQETMQNTHDFFAYFPLSDSFLNQNVKHHHAISGVLHKAGNLLVTRSDSLIHRGKFFTAAAIKGANLHLSTLAAITPLATIDHETAGIQKKFLLFAAVYLLIASGSIFLLRRRLLSPIAEFKTAIAAIGQRNFRTKLSISGKNEFGKLAEALNKTLENLHELEIARIVQDNLLPGDSFNQNRLTLYASLSQMSHIGGDYYDFFAANSHTTGIFIGDVSGHGISSALFMAMAKATLIYENFTEPSQEALLMALNKVIFQVRSSGAKEYMTGQAVFIDSLNGSFSAVNAGHCPAIIIRKNGICEMLKCRGLPLGFKVDPKFIPVTGKLEEGDWLILYTDGWIESESNTGLVFGFERFFTALKEHSSNNAEQFVKNMFTTINSWQNVCSDDLTLIVTRFGDKA